MTSRINTKSSQNGHSPGTAASVTQPPQTPPPNRYSPAVPISIYRQVASELQSTQTVLEAIKTQNQQLTEQNQQLRLEIERVVQSALQLRQVADNHTPHAAASTSEPDRSDVELHFVSAPATRTKPSEPISAPEQPTPPKPVVEQESQSRRPQATDRSQEVGGWWLVLIILLIVVTAFGTGFLIVRPLLPNR